jgi:hypothetical protein
MESFSTFSLGNSLGNSLINSQCLALCQSSLVTLLWQFGGSRMGMYIGILPSDVDLAGRGDPCDANPSPPWMTLNIGEEVGWTPIFRES